MEQLHAAFSERDYWLARLAAFGGLGKLDSITTDAGGTARIVVSQDLRRDVLPGLFAKLYPLECKVVQEETWSPLGDGRVRGDIRIITRGAPGSGHGTAVISPARNGSLLTCTATAEFKVPLVGGSIENVLGRQLVDQMPVIQEFTAKWIDENA